MEISGEEGKYLEADTKDNNIGGVDSESGRLYVVIGALGRNNVSLSSPISSHEDKRLVLRYLNFLSVKSKFTNIFHQ